MGEHHCPEQREVLQGIHPTSNKHHRLVPETETPCFTDQEESVRPGPEQVLQGQTQTERKEGRQEEHSRLDGWGQPDQET